MTRATYVSDTTDSEKELDLSIVMPALNEEKNVRAAIDSTLRAFDEFDIDGEIIVVNDGSDDRTQEIVTEAIARDDRVSAVRHESPQVIGASFWGGVGLAGVGLGAAQPVAVPDRRAALRTRRQHILRLVVPARAEVGRQKRILEALPLCVAAADAGKLRKDGLQVRYSVVIRLGREGVYAHYQGQRHLLGQRVARFSRLQKTRGKLAKQHIVARCSEG